MNRDNLDLIAAQRATRCAEILPATFGASVAFTIAVIGCGSSGATDSSGASASADSSSDASGSEDTSSEQPCPTDSGAGCAPLADRVDLIEPTFSNPTQITNPLFPISDLHSVVFIGLVDGLPFRTETTLLPETRTLEWNGQQIETVQSQYMAFSDGRIEEIATDWYAQADDGAVWYFGEDVADYDETGTIFTHEGTWLVGTDGAPIAMVMPPVAQLGNAWLAENIAPAAWEQITVVEVDKTLDGPAGPIDGVVITAEYKLDDSGEEKIFAPGYGEFSTGSLADENLEPLALAIPTDALDGATPAELAAFASGTAAVFAAAQAADWTVAADALGTLTAAWESFRADNQTPPLLHDETVRLLAELDDAVLAESSVDASHSAIALGRLAYDFRLRHETVSDIDRVRFDMWLAQIAVDVDANDLGSVKGDVATAELVWDRVDHTFDAAAAQEIASQLAELRAAAETEDSGQAALLAAALRMTMTDFGWK